jgi:hypothetical protein
MRTTILCLLSLLVAACAAAPPTSESLKLESMPPTIASPLRNHRPSPQAPPFLLAPDEPEPAPTPFPTPLYYDIEPVNSKTVAAASLRSRPRLNSPILINLAPESVVQPLGRNKESDWIYVAAAHQQGWLHYSVLSFPSQAMNNDLPVLSFSENAVDHVMRTDLLRVGPGEEYEAIEIVGRDEPVVVVGRDENAAWLLVAYGSLVGWLAEPSLRYKVPLHDLPVYAAGAEQEPFTVVEFALGGQTHTLDYPGLMRQAGMTWVKLQYKWRPGDEAQTAIAGKVQEARSQGFKVLFSITGHPYPAYIDYVSFIEFMAGVAALGPDAPDAVEVWNEMNIDFEWPAGRIDPHLYVNRMLAPVYRTMKQVNPDVLIISGAPAPTGWHNGQNAWSDYRYIAGMAAAGAADYADCIGVHYNSGATSPATTSGHPFGEFPGWYFQPHLDNYWETFGGALPLCFTELGYLSQDGYGAIPERFQWASRTTEAQQAHWLVEAVKLAMQSNKVRLLIVFNVDFTDWSESDPQAGFAILRPFGGCLACELLGRLEGEEVNR